MADDISPEQLAILEQRLRRQAEAETMSPIGAMMGGAIPGAAAGYAAQRFGRYLAGSPKWDSPLWLRSLMGLGSGAAGAGMGALTAHGQYQNKIRDAEGQAGGFYGQAPPPSRGLWP